MQRLILPGCWFFLTLLHGFLGPNLSDAAPPPGQSAYLNGMHDIESAGWLKGATSGSDKGWLTDLRYIGTSGTPGVECHTSSTQAGISIIQRLDVSGTESYPRTSSRTPGYANNFATYVSRCPNIHVWIVGNEPNFTEHKSDPNCTSAAYAAAYVAVHKKVHALPGHQNDLVLVASNSPYSPGCIESLRQIIKNIQKAGVQPDGFALHAYTRAPNGGALNAGYVTSTATQNDRTRRECPGPATWNDTWHSHFRIYMDYIKAIESFQLTGRPVFITESGNACDPKSGNSCYPNKDIGYFQALYKEAHRWNQLNTTKTCIRAITPYRWTKNDDGTGRDFAIGQRPSLLQDLKKAFAQKYKWETARCSGGSGGCKSDSDCPPNQTCNTSTGICQTPKSTCKQPSDCQSPKLCSPASCTDTPGECVERGAGTFGLTPTTPKPGSGVEVSFQHPTGYAFIGLSYCGPTQGKGKFLGVDKTTNKQFRWKFSIPSLQEGWYRVQFTADNETQVVGRTVFYVGGCTLGSTRCQSNVYQSCELTEGRPTWKNKETCAAGCTNQGCHECSAQGQRCQGNTLQRCDANASPRIWVTSQTCPYGCKNNACLPCNTSSCKEAPTCDGGPCPPAPERTQAPEPTTPEPTTNGPEGPTDPGQILVLDNTADQRVTRPRGCGCDSTSSPFPLGLLSLWLFLLLYRRKTAIRS